MIRALILGVLLVFVAGSCQTPPEKILLKPLPAEGEPIPYSELIQRARVQAMSANEAFFKNDWSELEEAAKSVEQTARAIPKATEVPAKLQSNLAAQANDLVKEASLLREAAKGKDDQKSNEALQRLHFKVRSLRPEN